MTREARFELRKARVKKCLSLQQLSSKINIPANIINTWESNGHKITNNNFLLLSKALETSPNELIFSEDDKYILDLKNLTPSQINIVRMVYKSFMENEE